MELPHFGFPTRVHTAVAADNATVLFVAMLEFNKRVTLATRDHIRDIIEQKYPSDEEVVHTWRTQQVNTEWEKYKSQLIRTIVHDSNTKKALTANFGQLSFR